MSDAVAKLRFDLLANMAGFTGPMKDAGDQADKAAARFNKAFDSSKQAADRASKASSGWKEAFGTDESFSGRSTAATKNAVRWNDMVPWGKSARVAISQEAALTAAELGKQATSLKEIIGRMGEQIGSVAGEGVGSLVGSLGRFAMGPAGIATAAIGGLAAIHHGGMEWAAERRQRASDARNFALETGSGIEDASRLQAVGIDGTTAARFQKSLAEGSAGFGELGLNANKLKAEPLKDAMLEVSAALEKVHDPTLKVKAAIDIFGKSGAELLPVLDKLGIKMGRLTEEEVVTPEQAAKAKLRDQADKENNRQYGQLTGGFYRAVGFDESSGMFGARNRASLWAGLRGDFQGAKDIQQRGMEADDAARNAQADEDARLAAQKLAVEHEKTAAAAHLAAEKLKAISDATVGLGDKLGDSTFAAALGDHGSEVAKFMRDFQDGKVSSPDVRQKNFGAFENEAGARFRAHLQDIDDLGAAAAIRDRDQKSPEAKLARTLHGIDLLAMQSQRGDETEADASRRFNPYRDRAKADYLKEKGLADPLQEFQEEFAKQLQAGVDRNDPRMRKLGGALGKRILDEVSDGLATEEENFRARDKAVDKMREEGLPADVADRLGTENRQNHLAALGIRDPESEFKKKFQDLVDAKANNDITQEQFDRRRRDLRRAGADEAAGEVKTVSPIAAMAAGSREAYSMLVRTQLDDPKTEAAKKMVGKLDAIEKNTRPRQDRGGNVLGL